MNPVETAAVGVGIHHGFMLPRLKIAVLGEQSIAGSTELVYVGCRWNR